MFVCTHTLGSVWKQAFGAAPWWVKQVMDNGMWGERVGGGSEGGGKGGGGGGGKGGGGGGRRMEKGWGGGGREGEGGEEGERVGEGGGNGGGRACSDPPIRALALPPSLPKV